MTYGGVVTEYGVHGDGTATIIPDEHIVPQLVLNTSSTNPSRISLHKITKTSSLYQSSYLISVKLLIVHGYEAVLTSKAGKLRSSVERFPYIDHSAASLLMPLISNRVFSTKFVCGVFQVISLENRISCRLTWVQAVL
jgi:hypothetical protein